MGEKKRVGEFLRKTFALKKEEENKSEKKPASKTAAKPAAKRPARPPAKTAASPAAKTKVKPASQIAAKPPAKKIQSVAQPTAQTAEKTVSKTPVSFSKNMTKADNVRLYIYQNYLKPAKLKGQNRITLIAGEVHSAMGLKSEIPTVASAMKTRIDRLYDVEILEIKPPGASNSKLTVKYDLKNLYMEEEAVKPASEKSEKTGAENPGPPTTSAADVQDSYLILKELEEKLRLFVSERVEARFGKEWWKGTDMSFLADRWNERRIMNDRTNAEDRKSVV